MSAFSTSRWRASPSARGVPSELTIATGTPDPALTTTRRRSGFCGESSMGKHFQSIDSQVLSRIYGHGGALYDYPVEHPKLGRVAPSGGRRGARHRPARRSPPTAGRCLRRQRPCLSEQVPTKIVFLTDGPARRVKLARHEIVLMRTTPRNMATAGRKSGTVIQALRHIGQRHVDDKMVSIVDRQAEPCRPGSVAQGPSIRSGLVCRPAAPSGQGRRLMDGVVKMSAEERRRNPSPLTRASSFAREQPSTVPVTMVDVRIVRVQVQDRLVDVAMGVRLVRGLVPVVGVLVVVVVDVAVRVVERRRARARARDAP